MEALMEDALLWRTAAAVAETARAVGGGWMARHAHGALLVEAQRAEGGRRHGEAWHQAGR